MEKVFSKKNIGIFVCLCTLLIMSYALLDFYIKEAIKNRVYSSSNEFVKTVECAKYFDAEPEAFFCITFDIRAEKSGKMLVYQQNGLDSRYAFEKFIDVTEEYQTFSIVVKPQLVKEECNMSYLSFYGEYGSGVIPEVKNISITVYEAEKTGTYSDSEDIFIK